MSSCVLLRWSFVRWFVTGVGAAALVACQARSVEAPRINPERVIHHDIPISQNRDIDLLFMVDKSPTMADEQASLAANFPRFINVLQNIPGGLPNVHIGVITQDIGAGGFSTGGTCKGEGDAGRLQAAPRVAGCTPPSGAFITDVVGSEGTRQTNYAGTLADTFACIAQVGPDGCGFEQHLESLKRALDGSVPENQGFLRKDAYLGIIILSDEDDCSAFDGSVFNPINGSLTDPLGPLSDFRCAEFGWTCDGGPVARASAVYDSCVPRENSPFLNHPRTYAEFIRGLKSDPNLIIVAGIIGDDARFEVGPTNDSFMNPEVKPACMRGTQSAEPMPRIRHFTEQFPDRNSFVSICDADLAPGLEVIAQLLARVLGNRCLNGQVDTRDLEPAQPGLQLDCQASEGRAQGGVWREELALPRCVMADDTTPAGGSSPCWYVVADALNCAAAPDQLSVRTHPADRMPAPGTRLKMQCVGAPL